MVRRRDLDRLVGVSSRLAVCGGRLAPSPAVIRALPTRPSIALSAVWMGGPKSGRRSQRHAPQAAAIGQHHKVLRAGRRLPRFPCAPRDLVHGICAGSVVPYPLPGGDPHAEGQGDCVRASSLPRGILRAADALFGRGTATTTYICSRVSQGWRRQADGAPHPRARQLRRVHTHVPPHALHRRGKPRSCSHSSTRSLASPALMSRPSPSRAVPGGRPHHLPRPGIGRLHQ